jgi:hypothetical protein
MKRRAAWASLALALMMLAPTGAVAQRDRDYDWYRDIGIWLGRGGEAATRRVRLIEQYSQLRTGVRRAERGGQLSARDADRLYGRLDRVARFLRDDQHLNGKEYSRRQNDLDEVARDLRRATGDRYGRGDSLGR